ncbi:aminodeoxychorismate synthase component I [candidate division KSB1 bacterium]|nr:MAG: aminodeoxychorismate synthase component I [candidate division KSB1 bacterium]
MNSESNHETGTVYVQTAEGWLCFYRPQRIITTENSNGVLHALEEVDAATNRGLWAAGFVTYEAAPAFDAAFVTREKSTLPLLWFGIYNRAEKLDAFPTATEEPEFHPEWKSTISRDEYAAAIAQIKEHIAFGNSYQVNFTMRLRAAFAGDAWALFLSLIHPRESGYAAYVHTGNHVLCSASPELFFELRGEEITCRPMKGTAPRGLTVEDDYERKNRLVCSVKERAENVMIVDMVRNDLSRIAEPGSVHVPSLFDVERYDTVFQMTSTVKAWTREPLSKIFAALFPCASITGAPKIRTMRIISELETSPRGIYTGCIGFAAPDRRAQFNVAIRTVHVDREKGLAEYGTGGGIVWDSKTEDEFAEAHVKAAILTVRRSEFQLLETMLWRPGNGFFLLERHLNRLCASADYFGFHADREDIQNRLVEFAVTFAQQPQKVRLRLEQNGAISINAEPLANAGSRIWKIRLADKPVDVQDRFLYHKTTHRAVYEEARQTQPDCDDVILWNPDGEITESTIANVVVQKSGKLITPPIKCGLLGGTYRAYLLEKGRIHEDIVKKSDLPHVERIYLINSVRGWIPAKLV